MEKMLTMLLSTCLARGAYAVKDGAGPRAGARPPHRVAVGGEGMASSRRIGTPDAKNRTVLIDAAERLMLEEGHAAVTSRRVAARAGLKPQLVHYYFRTMDDLFLAVFRRRSEEGLKRQAEALASARPLWALWKFNTDPSAATITMEFIGLANHRKVIRAEIAHYAERFRRAQLEAMPRLMERYRLPPDAPPPAALIVLMTSVSRVVMLETALGLSTGHAETLEFIERHLLRIEGPPHEGLPGEGLPGEGLPREDLPREGP
jgi:TetR/AcrR family transcriptional regulator